MEARHCKQPGAREVMVVVNVVLFSKNSHT